MQTQEIVNAIYSVGTMEDLNRVYEAFKTRSKELQTRIATKFREGEKVEFDSKRGMTVRGTVKKVNSKSIVVKTDAGNWKVSPSLLRKTA